MENNQGIHWGVPIPQITVCWFNPSSFDFRDLNGLDHCYEEWLQTHDCPEDTEGEERAHNYCCDCEYDYSMDYVTWSDDEWLWDTEADRYFSPNGKLIVFQNNNDFSAAVEKSNIIGYRGLGSPCIPGQCNENTLGQTRCYLVPLEYLYDYSNLSEELTLAEWEEYYRFFPLEDLKSFRDLYPKFLTLSEEEKLDKVQQYENSRLEEALV